MPIICKAKIAGVQFYEMTRKQQLQGYIHSVFERVVNIEVPIDSLPDTLFSFGREDVSPAPAMLITNVEKDISLGSLGLKQGDWVRVHPDCISTTKLDISTSGVQVWEPVGTVEIQRTDLCSHSELMARIKEIISALNTSKQSAALPDAVFNQAAGAYSNYDQSVSQELVMRANDLLRHALDGTHSNDAVDALLGFGLGLTPSGDDIIAGYLHGLCYIERYTGSEAVWKDNMITSLEQKLSGTNRISRHFLHYAMKGFWSKDIELFLLDVTRKKTISCLSSAQRLTSFGASSGFDILTGICIGLLAGYRSLIKE